MPEFKPGESLLGMGLHGRCYMCALVALALLGAMAWSHHNRRKQARVRALQINANYTASRPRILVLLHSYRDKRTGQTIFNLFERATCPLRVTVAVWQENNHRKDVDCWSCYESLIPGHRASPRNGFADLVRVVNRRSSTSLGRLHAIRESMRLMDMDESFTLIFQPGIEIAHNWDTVLLNFMGDAERTSSCDATAPRVVLTQLPGDARENQCRSVVDAPGTFPILQKKYRIVSLCPRPFRYRPRHPVPCLAVTSMMCFMRTDVLRRALDASVVQAAPLYAADLLLSSMLYDAGASFYAVPCQMTWGAPSKRVSNYRPPGWGSTIPVVSPSYSRFCGATATEVSERASTVPDAESNVYFP